MINFKQYNIITEDAKRHVTFDFDWTLKTKKGSVNTIGLDYLKKELTRDDTTVSILTTRKENEGHREEIERFLNKYTSDDNDSLVKTYFFTNGADKADYINKNIKSIKIDKHYDEDPYEIKTINDKTKTKCQKVDITQKLKDEWKEEYGIDWDPKPIKKEWSPQGTRWDAGDFCESKELPILLLTIGIPGSGKSTWIKKKKGFKVVSPDVIRVGLTGDISDQSQNALVFKIAKDNITKHLNDGKNVIFDATNVDTASRKKFVKELPKAQLQAKMFDIEPKEAKDRIKKRKNGSNVPDDVVDLMHTQYQHTKKVIKDEGYEIVNEFNQPNSSTINPQGYMY